MLHGEGGWSLAVIQCNGQVFFESASIGSNKWRPTGYLNVFSILTQWLQWSNVRLLFLSLFLPCHPITTQFLGHHRHPCPFQPKIKHFALRGPCRCHRHTDGYFTTTCHALRSSCTSPAFRKGHSIAAKLGWRSLKYHCCNLKQTQTFETGCLTLVLKRMTCELRLPWNSLSLEQIRCPGLVDPCVQASKSWQI